MSRAAMVLLLILAGCDRHAATPAGGAGARIEASAIAAGLVADPARASLIGAWARDPDRMCVGPERSGGAAVGVALDYGDGQACVARGTADRHGARVDLAFGECRVAARFEGDRIVLPATVPAACDRLCTGRASLAALTVERQSGSAADAVAMIAPDGVALCPR